MSMKTLKLNREVLDRILRHCVESYPYECCGLMLGREDEGGKIVVDVVRVRNVHEEDRRVRYMIDPMEYYEVERQAEQRGLKVVGIYHSHPNVPARPSQYDLNHSFPWYSYLIVSVSGEKVNEYRSWVRDDSGDNPRFVEQKVEVTE